MPIHFCKGTFSMPTQTTKKINKKELLLQIDAEKCKRSLHYFARAVWPLIEPVEFIDGMPFQAMVKHLEAVSVGHITRLLINIPPRHTKSTLISVIWPVWIWLQSPSERFLCASYSLDLSTRDNARKRHIIEDPWFVERFSSIFTLTGDQNTKRFFQNNQNGYHMAVSTGGSTTGQGGSYLLLDDPHNVDETYSDVERQSAVTWFREVWTNRLNNQKKDKMVVVGQRIHENDVCGYILRERTDWVHLNLPAFYEESRKCITPIWKDPRNAEGELLWPERLDKRILDGLRKDLGSIGFAAQYQQRPVPLTGGQFKKHWVKYFTQEHAFFHLHIDQHITKIIPFAKCQIMFTVDLAISTKQTADFTVISVWAVTPDKDLLLLDRVREHLDNPEQIKYIKALYTKYTPFAINVENVAYQLAFIQQLLKEGLPAREYKPIKDKMSRASTAAVFYEAGKVFHPLNALWLQEWEDELFMFPMSEHDDQVDTVSMACDMLGALILNAEDHIAALQRRVALVQQRQGIFIVQKDEQNEQETA